MDFDFHTHNLNAPEGKAIINLPEAALLQPDSFELRSGCLYSAGIHPWWTIGDVTPLLEGLQQWAKHPQVTAIGECGFDTLRGGNLTQQSEIFALHVRLADERHKPLIVHCVRAFDRLLQAHRRLHPHTTWVIHGFRGKPALARQLLSAGFHLSYGKRYNPESLRITPPDRLHFETDDTPAHAL